MNRQHSWKKTEEIELNLADLLRQLCIKWKQILVCALIFAIFAGGYGWMKNKDRLNIRETVEDAELTEEELSSVMSAVELHREVRMQEEYLENSVLMKMDPYHKHRISMLYSVQGAEWKDILKITESYLNFVVNGGAADALQKSGSSVWDIDKSYLAELLTAYQKNYDFPYQKIAENSVETNMLAESLFYVEIIGLNESLAKQMMESVQMVLKKQSAKMKEQAGSHKLALLSTEHNIQADSNLLAQQRDKKAQFVSNTANLKAVTDAFSGKQLAVYQKEAGIEDEKLSKGSDSDKDNTESLKETGSPAGFAVAVRYIVLGIIGGVFVYCAAFGCWYLFRDTVKSGEEMKNLYTFPFYGSIPRENAPKDIVEQADAQLLNRIRLACKKQGITKFCAASDFSYTEKEKQCMENMSNHLSGWGIHTVIAENAAMNTELWDTLMETGTVLLVCRAGTTTHRMIDDAMGFYQENGIYVAGAMAFECK